MKWIHYTEQDEYFKNPNFIPSYSMSGKVHPSVIGMLRNEKIAVKRLTKKEEEKEHLKFIKFFYKELKDSGLPFLEDYKENDKYYRLGWLFGLEIRRDK